MKTQKITGSQLRGMIKEALEESVVEIALDEQISALKVKGSKRTLKESKKYHKLLEAKIAFMKELASGGEEKSALSGSAADRVKKGIDRAVGVIGTDPKKGLEFVKGTVEAVVTQQPNIKLPNLITTIKNEYAKAKAQAKEKAAKPGSEKGINVPVEKVEGGLLGGTGSKPGAGDKI